MATNRMVTNSTDDAGKLVLRLTLALLLLFHGISKVTGGVGAISHMLASAGLPTFLAYLVYVGEVVAPLLILFGVFTRAAAVVVVINMIVALALVHTADFLKISKMGGWALELQAFYLLSALAVAMLGAGRFSVAGKGGRFN